MTRYNTLWTFVQYLRHSPGSSLTDHPVGGGGLPYCLRFLQGCRDNYDKFVPIFTPTEEERRSDLPRLMARYRHMVVDGDEGFVPKLEKIVAEAMVCPPEYFILFFHIAKEIAKEILDFHNEINALFGLDEDFSERAEDALKSFLHLKTRQPDVDTILSLRKQLSACSSSPATSAEETKEYPYSDADSVCSGACYALYTNPTFESPIGSDPEDRPACESEPEPEPEEAILAIPPTPSEPDPVAMPKNTKKVDMVFIVYICVFLVAFLVAFRPFLSPPRSCHAVWDLPVCSVWEPLLEEFRRPLPVPSPAVPPAPLAPPVCSVWEPLLEEFHAPPAPVPVPALVPASANIRLHYGIRITCILAFVVVPIFVVPLLKKRVGRGRHPR